MIMPILQSREPRPRQVHSLAHGHSGNEESLGFAVELVRKTAAQARP